MRPQLLLAITLLSLSGAACHRQKVAPPVVVAETPPQPTPEEIAARIARRKKAEAARLAKIRSQAREALERGREQLREEKNSEALQAFNEAVKLDRESVDAWLRIAYVYEQEGDELHAAEAFEEVKRLWAL
jgi:tetratricopeptide (TPR) repeat protein